MLTAVLITHLHSDHLSDLNDVITTHWVMSPTPTTLTIYGPPRLQEVVDGLLAMLGPDIEYRLAHHADLNEAPLDRGDRGRPGRRAHHRLGDREGRCDGSPAGGADGRVPHRGRRSLGGARRRRRAVRQPRRAVPGRGRVRADRAARGHREDGAEPALPGDPRLPLERARTRRRPRRAPASARSCSRTTSPGSPPARTRSGEPWLPSTSPAPSSSATTSPPSTCNQESPETFGNRSGRLPEGRRPTSGAAGVIGGYGHCK